MAENNIKQTTINCLLIYIVGLCQAIKKVNPRIVNDEEIKNTPMKSIAINKSIPSSACEAYGMALLREYKIAMRVFSEEPLEGLNIEVVGM